MARLADARSLIQAILASDQPADALLRTLEQLDAQHDLHIQAAVFEAVMWRVDAREFWVWYRMGRVYDALGRADACFFCSARAMQMQPEHAASLLPYRDMFRHFREHGDAASAADVVVRQRRHAPDQPIAQADETDGLFRELGRDPAEGHGVPGPVAAVFGQLASVIRATFDQPRLELRSEMTADDVPGWDSLTHATLLVQVERTFGIRFDAAEIGDLGTVGSLAALIARKTSAGLPGNPKLIVYGNCQAGALAHVLKTTPAIAARFDVVMHDLWAKGEELARNLQDFPIAEAMLLQDVRNWRDHPLCDALPPGLRVVRFPFCYVRALWPFDAMLAGADEKMERLMRRVEENGDIFPFGFQDGLLARLRERVPDPEERFRRYRDLDVQDAPDIARYAELDEMRLLADDARLGCTIGRYIVENYRHKQLFHAIAHPTAELIGRLADELVRRLGIDPGEAGLATYSDYMGHCQVPLHPRVIRTLGIAWADESTRYSFHEHEHLTFEEYYRRYIAVAVGD